MAPHNSGDLFAQFIFIEVQAITNLDGLIYATVMVCDGILSQLELGAACGWAFFM